MNQIIIRFIGIGLQLFIVFQDHRKNSHAVVLHFKNSSRYQIVHSDKHEVAVNIRVVPS